MTQQTVEATNASKATLAPGPSKTPERTKEKKVIFLFGDSLFQRAWAKDGVAARLAGAIHCHLLASAQWKPDVPDS